LNHLLDLNINKEVDMGYVYEKPMLVARLMIKVVAVVMVGG
jgi:hypothetical protein